MPRAIPIIRLHGNLLVSIQIALSDHVILDLKDDIGREIRMYEPNGLVIEVSGVDLFDSFIARSIQELSKMARLMGVRTILAGLNAGMAITLVEMGMLLEGVDTSLNLEAALERLNAHRQKDGQFGDRNGTAALHADEDFLIAEAERR